MKIKVKISIPHEGIEIGNELDAIVSPNGQQAMVFTKNNYSYAFSSLDFEVVKEEEKSTGGSSMRSVLGQDVKTLNVEFK